MKNNITLKNTAEKLLDNIYLVRCPYCGVIIFQGQYICEKCEMDFEYRPRRFYCGGTLSYAVCDYNAINRRIVLGAKEQRDGDKLRFMGAAIYKALLENKALSEFDVIVPVPTHILKRITRGYNHTEKIAAELSRLSGKRVLCALEKTKFTFQQKHLDRARRLRNLEGAFRVSEDVKGKRLLLLDDVSTTGGTVYWASHELVKGGSKSVVCACFAKTEYNRNYI